MIAKNKTLIKLMQITSYVLTTLPGQIFKRSLNSNGINPRDLFLSTAIFELKISQHELLDFLGLKGINISKLKKKMREVGNDSWLKLIQKIGLLARADVGVIYIAGRVSGLSYDEVKAKFQYAEDFLKEMGYLVINPVELVPMTANWELAMRILLPYLSICDTLCLLPDWKESKGAVLEYELAKTLGLSVFELDSLITKNKGEASNAVGASEETCVAGS